MYVYVYIYIYTHIYTHSSTNVNTNNDDHIDITYNNIIQSATPSYYIIVSYTIPLLQGGNKLWRVAASLKVARDHLFGGESLV